jgi:hypothetical protein
MRSRPPDLPAYLDPVAEYLLLPSYLRMLLFRYAGVTLGILAMVSTVGTVALSVFLYFLPKKYFFPKESQSFNDNVVLGGYALWFLLLFLSISIFRGLRASGDALFFLKVDPRKPILYLRSFSIDRNDVAELFGGLTYEQDLASAVSPYGPLVAIGIPGEALPPTGAARLYVDDADHWKAVVKQLIATSQFVIFRFGEGRSRGESFWWEFKHVVSTREPERVLIFLPSQISSKDYRVLCDKVKDVLSVDLPPQTSGALFLAFGPAWRPFLVGVPKEPVNAFARAFVRRSRQNPFAPWPAPWAARSPERALGDALATLPFIAARIRELQPKGQQSSDCEAFGNRRKDDQA